MILKRLEFPIQDAVRLELSAWTLPVIQIREAVPLELNSQPSCFGQIRETVSLELSRLIRNAVRTELGGMGVAV
jgi:hypothetical protein